jgi:F0F1-type ATP synthase delta subunit
MTKKQIKKIAKLSYTKDLLDPKKVSTATKNMTRRELKDYIKALKNEELTRKVIVLTTSLKTTDSFNNQFKNLFPNKKLIFKKDPTLLGGVRVIDKDTVYDLNIKSRLENLVNYIKE